MTAMVRAEQVCKDFGALAVLKGVTLSVERGRVLVWWDLPVRVSRHSCAASTTRNRYRWKAYVDDVLVGYRESRGKLYEMAEREASRQRRDIGMVFQHFNLFPHRNRAGEHHRVPDTRQEG